MNTPVFRNELAETIFHQKYSHGGTHSWYSLAETIVDDVCGTSGGTKDMLLNKSEREYIVKLIKEFKFIPGGRYLYYAGRPV